MGALGVEANGATGLSEQATILPAASISKSFGLRLRDASFALIVLCALAVPYGFVVRSIISDFDPMVLTAVFIASSTSSIGGFAFSAICGALLFHLMKDPVAIVQIMLVCSITGQLAMVWSLRRFIEARPLAPYLIGGVLGLPVGLFVLMNADRASYSRAIGVVIAAYGVYMLFRKPLRLSLRSIYADSLIGFVGGVTGGAVAFPGASVTIWLSLKDLTKERQRAIYQPFILLMQMATVASLLVLKRHSVGSAFDWSALAYAPAALLGTWCGMSYFKALGDRQFMIAVNLLLVLSGLGLMI